MRKITFISFMLVLFMALSACSDDDTSKPQPEEEILLNEAFDNNDYGWPTGMEDDGKVEFRVNEGHYYFRNNNTAYNYFVYFFTDFTVGAKQAVEISVKPANEQNDSYYGLFFYNTDADDQMADSYYLLIGYGYEFTIQKRIGGEVSRIVDWTVSDHVKENEYNILRIEKDAALCTFFINKVKVHQMPIQEMDLSRSALLCGMEAAFLTDYIKTSQIAAPAPETAMKDAEAKTQSITSRTGVSKSDFHH